MGVTGGVRVAIECRLSHAPDNPSGGITFAVGPVGDEVVVQEAGERDRHVQVGITARRTDRSDSISPTSSTQCCPHPSLSLKDAVGSTPTLVGDLHGQGPGSR